MNRPTHLLFISLLLSAFLFVACNKGDLQRQPGTAFDVARSPEALQALLDNDWLFGQSPAAGILSGESFSLTDEYCNFLLPFELNLYTWQSSIYSEGETVSDWNLSYEQVTCANQVIEAIEQLSNGTAGPAYGPLLGSGRFLRAWAFWQLAQLYAQPYDSLQADSVPGIPLPVTADLNAPITRASLQQTYQQICTDLQQATDLLPATIDKAHPNRPSRAAAWAMLARVYLSMRNYQQAAIAAGNCLQLYKTLTDYQQSDTTASIPFSGNHPEIIYQSRMQEDTRFLGGLVNGNNGFINADLYSKYTPGDLRRQLFFKGVDTQAQLKGSYAGTFYPFTGLATNEVYLTHAESLAKMGQTAAALNDLDTLLMKRFAPGYYIPRKSNHPDTVLSWIRTEREKELVLHGQRWTDIRRLNKEGKQIYFTRRVKGTLYTLTPNDPKYTLPIPPQAVKENGLQQNPR
ncbi:RagB/SusD family nutrient uptake outer membrane protein [Paraflavitalea soli]|uniref:RagB/SusD family nutrient uptake outer membrane protein n=1 Tax=Paraflavitalea soli TaxID=2315862 RepID=A0A3B7MP03_9BACT|nr:RagB/SusD family nutrient uptake outer membrane protein [Paraflavitalea soli]AXY74780.1 RagB/SusD family nutrient uptake outer membrane protein [Paraflavitalea soli]